MCSGFVNPGCIKKSAYTHAFEARDHGFWQRPIQQTGSALAGSTLQASNVTYWQPIINFKYQGGPVSI